jgi:CBS domain-containing protein
VTLQDILGIKGHAVFGIDSQATLAEAARTLVEHKVGSLLVFRPGEREERDLVGIITERDILYSCAADNLPLATTRVAEIMTTKLITGLPNDPVESVMGLMTSKRIRHLPVLSEGKLLGIVSIGDIVKAQHDRLVMENQFMKDYVQGVSPR